MTTERKRVADCTPERRQQHLKQLEVLIGRQPSFEELLPFEAVEELRSRLIAVQFYPQVSAEFAFGSIESQRVKEQLLTIGNKKTYVWTPSSNDCGLLPPIRLALFNWDFPFGVNPEGIISLVTEDLADRIILDFSEDAEGRVLEIEAMGPNWGSLQLES